MNKRIRWAAATLVLALAAGGGYAALATDAAVSSQPTAADSPAGVPDVPAPSATSGGGEPVGSTPAPGTSDGPQDGGPRGGGDPDEPSGEEPVDPPDAGGKKAAIGGIKPNPSPPVAVDFSAAQQHKGRPGKDAAAGSGYTTGLTGCQLECIHTAKVAASGTSATFTLGTKVPTRMWVILTGEGMKDSGPELTKNWQTSFTGLKANHSYDVTIAVEDAEGHARHVYGKFTTLRRMALVRYQHVKVIFDGDNGANRGELRFYFEVGGESGGSTPQDKIGSGDTVALPDGYGALVGNAPEKLQLKVTGVENDYTGRTFKKYKDDCYNPFTEHSKIVTTNGGSCWDTARATATYDISTPATDDPAKPGGTDIGFSVGTTRNKPKFTSYGAITVWYE